VREWFNVRSRGGVLVLADGTGVGTAGLGAAVAVLDWASAAAGTSSVLVAWTPADAFEVAPLLRAIHKARASGVPLAAARSEAVSVAREASDAAPAAPAAWAGLRVFGRLQ